MDFEKILADLQAEAAKVAEDLELERRLEQGRELAGEAKERLETDPKARMIAAGAGGLLLAGLLGNKGGRRLVGGVAKTGAVAALGALAYRAWINKAEAEEGDARAAATAGYVTDETADAAFAEAIVRVMVAAAHADGQVDASEQDMIDGELDRAGVNAETRAALLQPLTGEALYNVVQKAALSPNHSAQLYAAASVVMADKTRSEQAFLKELAERLGVHVEHAAAIDG